MFANLKFRNSLHLLCVLLVVILLYGAASFNHPPTSALAQLSNDVFEPGSVFEPTSPTLAPAANFSADPTSGLPPLQVQFTDESTGSPTGWAWYFGDETYDAPWAQMTAAAEWSARSSLTSVALPDGSIVLMGGTDGSRRNDVWRSTDRGATWTQMTPAAEWTARQYHSSVALPDGSIVLMGGYDGSNRLNDVWRSTDRGATWTQMTPAAEWTARNTPTSVPLPDGSIVLMGGYDGSYRNDVWRSTDQGATWTQMTAAAGWAVRNGPTSVPLSNGSIVLMGGYDGSRLSDVWRSTDLGATWTQMTPAAEWSARYRHTSVALPDGSIVLMGGDGGSELLNDVWRSTNQGATWTQITANAPWTARRYHTSVALPDGSIVLMGGDDGVRRNDVWRMETAGSSAQNPTHIYTALGTYSVALQAYNADGFSSLRRSAYINVNTGDSSLYLPLILRNFPFTPDTPVLNDINNDDGDGSYTVSWSTSEGADTYTLQEATNTNFTDAVTVYSGPNASKDITGKDIGTYYYRVSAANAYASSGWSNVQIAQVTEPLPDCPQPGQWSGTTSQGLSITFEVQNSPVCQVVLIVLQVRNPFWGTLEIIPWGSQGNPITNDSFDTGLDTIGLYKARVAGTFSSYSTVYGTFYVEYYDYAKVPPLQWTVNGTWTATP